MTKSRKNLRAFLRAEEKRKSLRLKHDLCAQILDVRYRNGRIQCQVLWRSPNGELSSQPVWTDYEDVRTNESFVQCLKSLCEEAQLESKWSALLDLEYPEDKEEQERMAKEPLAFRIKHLKSLIDMEIPSFDVLEFHCYCILYARALETGFVGPNFLETFTQKRRIACYQRRRQKQLANLVALSSKVSELAGISIVFENLVDFEEPAQFKYISQCFSKDVIIPDDPIIGCECRSCNGYSQCCPNLSGTTVFPYRKDGTLLLEQGKAIYECNKRCKCDSRCHNRVVQHGPTVPFVIFKTADRGWGLKTTKPMKAGQFVCEYVGEIIDCGTADARGKEYDNTGLTYLFDLDYNNYDSPHTIDAFEFGNMSRFMNHSCDPNCAIWAVFIDCLDPNLPRLGIFTKRRLEAGEELTFDYNVGSGPANESHQNSSITGSPKKVSHIGQCHCKSKKCRNYLFDAAV